MLGDAYEELSAVSTALRTALRAWLDSHGEPDIEEALAAAANDWFADVDD